MTCFRFFDPRGTIAYYLAGATYRLSQIGKILTRGVVAEDKFTFILRLAEKLREEPRRIENIEWNFGRLG